MLVVLVCLAVLIRAINWSRKDVARRASKRKTRIFDVKKVDTVFLSLGRG